MPAERVIVRRDLDWWYMRVRCRPASALPDAIEAKKAVNSALGATFGQTGVAVPVDVLQWDDGQGRGILRAPASAARGVWAALSLQSNLSGRGELAWHIESASPHLVHLAVDRQV